MSVVSMLYADEREIMTGDSLQGHKIVIDTLAKDTLPVVLPDTICASELLNTIEVDQVLEEYLLDLLEEQAVLHARQQDSLLVLNDTVVQEKTLPTDTIWFDTLAVPECAPMLAAQYNPLCIELVFYPLEGNITWTREPDFGRLFFGKSVETLQKEQPAAKWFAQEEALYRLRREARSYISRNAAGLYVGMFDELPDLEILENPKISNKRWRNVYFEHDDIHMAENKIQVGKIGLSKWVRKGSALLQFSQNYVTKNWYKGGNSNVAVLGIAEGSINYDNKKNLYWENSGEWRVGFNSVNGDTLRKMNTSDDLFRLYSKLGVKAFKKFYYSLSAEFQTQFFDTYTEINSPTLKSSSFAPIRLNVSIGLDYKPNDNLSIMLSPLAYKFIYVMDTVRINQNDFGIETGKKALNELGSALKVVYSVQPIEEIQIDSRFYLYTNYKKVEVELEVVANFIINRYLSARVSLYPRFDNTAILSDGEKAKLQFKEFLSIGFSHKFRSTDKPSFRFKRIRR